MGRTVGSDRESFKFYTEENQEQQRDDNQDGQEYCQDSLCRIEYSERHKKNAIGIARVLDACLLCRVGD